MKPKAPKKRNPKPNCKSGFQIKMKPKAPKKRNPKPNCKSGFQKVSIFGGELANEGFKVDLTDPLTKRFWFKATKRKD